MQIALIVNAKSVAVVQQLRTVVVELREAGHQVRPHLTFEEGDARRFAREAAAEGVSLILAAGGDGTINEAANGIHDYLDLNASSGAGRSLPRLGIIPLGTANDLAQSLGIPTEIDQAVEIALRGVPIEINIGQVNGRCFLNVSTGGFGTEATGAASTSAKRALGTAAYLIEAIRRFAALELSDARFSADSVIYEGPFLLFAVGNAWRTGGGNELTPQADPSDWLLDVCIVKELSRVEFLGLLPDLRAGDHLDHPAVIYQQVRDLSVDSEVELQVNADGEPLRNRSFHYTVSPHTLILMVPPVGAHGTDDNKKHPRP